MKKVVSLIASIGISFMAFAQGGSRPLTVREVDGDPIAKRVDELIVSNGSLAKESERKVTLTIGAGGATAWDDIGNPDANDEIDFAAYTIELNVADFQIGDGGGVNYIGFDGTPTMTFNGTADINLPDNSVDDADLNLGTGATQVSASDMPDEDIGDITISSGVYTVDAGAIHDLTINVKEENTSNVTIGQAMYVSGSVGAGQTLVGLMDNTDSTKIRALGLAAEDISQNTTGSVRFRGELAGVDTLGTNAVNPNGETWAAGDILYCTNSGNSGGLTNVKPTSGRIIRAGYSLVGSHNNDTILVQPHENPTCLAAASGEDICIRMGDNDGAKKVCFRDYANNDVACVDSNGIYTCTGLTIGSAVIIEAELETLDGITAGTAAANKALVLDASLDIATINSLTATILIGALTGNADSATVGTTVTITDNENTAENNPIVFVAGADLDGGNLGLETDGDYHYNPSTGTVTATEFAGGGASLTSVDAITGDSATAFFDAGNIEHEYGGVEANISAYSGLLGVNGGATSEVDTEAELETHLGGLDVVCVTADDITSANLASIINGETGTGDPVFGTSPTIATPTITGNIKAEPKHIVFTIIDPLTAQTEDNEICIWPVTPAALTVTKIVVTLDASGNEVAGDIKYADTFIGLANSVVINVFDTSSGVLSDDTISSGAVASGKCIYMAFDSAPNTAIHQMSVDITFDYD